MDEHQRQAVLDEWEARCRNSAVRNPAGYLSGIVQKANRGGVPCLGRMPAALHPCPIPHPQGQALPVRRSYRFTSRACAQSWSNPDGGASQCHPQGTGATGSLPSDKRLAAEFVQSDFRDLVIHGIAPDGSVGWPAAGIVRALSEASVELAVEDWTPVAIAGRWITQRYPEQQPTKCGCASWRQVLADLATPWPHEGESKRRTPESWPRSLILRGAGEANRIRNPTR